MIYLRIDIVLLERLRGVEEAGIYAVAARLSEVWYMVPVALMGAVFPALWSRRSDGPAYQRSLQGSLDALFAVALALAVFLQFAGRPLVHLLFGTAFSASTPVLQIHIWAGMFIFMRALLSRWLLAEDLLRFSLVTHVAGAVDERRTQPHADSTLRGSRSRSCDGDLVCDRRVAGPVPFGAHAADGVDDGEVAAAAVSLGRPVGVIRVACSRSARGPRQAA